MQRSIIDSEKTAVSVPIIGYHHSALSKKFGVPRQPNLVTLPSYIEMLAPYNTADAFAGITTYSHLWITWQTHQNRPQQTFKPKVRPPRLGGNSKLGVFATRSTYRPSQLGLSVVTLTTVEQTDGGVIIHITGADMVDGTPIIDIKPYIAYSDAINEADSGFAPDKPAIKSVRISEQAADALQSLVDPSLTQHNHKDQNLHQLYAYDIDIICNLISQDPRPAYRQYDTERVFIMTYKHYDVSFQMDNNNVIWIVAVTVVML